MKLLFMKGADVDIKDQAGWTPVYLAAYYGHLDVLKFLAVKVKGLTRSVCNQHFIINFPYPPPSPIFCRAVMSSKRTNRVKNPLMWRNLKTFVIFSEMHPKKFEKSSD